MNAKQCAKLAFGNPGFFDFLVPVTQLAKSLSPAFQLIDIAQKTTGVDVHQLAAATSPPLARALDIAETVSGGAVLASGGVAAAALAAPVLAGITVPSLGGLGAAGGTLGSVYQKIAGASDAIVGDVTDDDIFSDVFDEDDAGPDEE